jgi:nitrogen regulatory protein P-II 1
MKLITAVIQENRLDRVREELIAEEVYRITVGRVSGRGQQVGEEIYRGQRVTPDLLPKIRIDIAVNEDFVERAIRAIIKGARGNSEGQIGDGKILVTPLEECIRIRTGERGSGAI